MSTAGKKIWMRVPRRDSTFHMEGGQRKLILFIGQVVKPNMLLGKS